jgi:excisionase family DNA binding protein
MVEFNSISQAIKILGISRPTIWRKIKDGVIPAVRLGGRVLIPVVFFEELESKALATVAHSEGKL